MGSWAIGKTGTKNKQSEEDCAEGRIRKKATINRKINIGNFLVIWKCAGNHLVLNGYKNIKNKIIGACKFVCGFWRVVNFHFQTFLKRSMLIFVLK